MNIEETKPTLKEEPIIDQRDCLEVEEEGIPLITVSGVSTFPGMLIHFEIGREKSIKALEAAMERDQRILVSEQIDPDEDEPTPEGIFKVGAVAKVKQTLKTPNAQYRVLMEVQERTEIVKYLKEEPYFEVAAKPVSKLFFDTKETRALVNLIQNAYTVIAMQTQKIGSPDIMNRVEATEDPNDLIDLICANMMMELEDSQRIMQETQIDKRLMITYEVLTNEMEMIDIESRIDERVKSELDKNQREYVLREQLKVIQDELGDESSLDAAEDYTNRLNALDVSDEVHDKVMTEINRLKKVPQGSAEASVIETYIEWVLDLPWNTLSKEEVSVKKVRRVLNKDHYGLEHVKERILEYIAVLKLSNSLKSPILCLVGPPGVGKTSIARSIASSLNREYVRMSLGGMRDEAEIRGHRRTYIGAIPGRIIYHLKQCGTKNPLFLLDEIDKMSQDFRGDPASALLEVLDPEQNSTFTDNYLELPFDLSNVLFLTTANSLSTIPRPLLDRMEIIEVNGYVESEKLEIAKRYLVPKQSEIHGLTASTFKINKKALEQIVEYYTRESGVRELERQIARVCRVAAKEIVENDLETVSVTPKTLENYLGMKKFSFDTVDDHKEIGLVNGLAWTSVGGETLEIEVLVVDGKGKVIITGQLGDVMQESAKAAISYIRSQAQKLGIAPDFYEKKDIHLHVPEGAVPKDGPSAGITMTTALISALAKKPVPRNLAMTGEITLRGRVLPIGGLREKLTAAHRAGIKTIILPKENKKDLEEVPEIVINALDIHPVETMEEVIDLVFGKLK